MASLINTDAFILNARRVLVRSSTNALYAAYYDNSEFIVLKKSIDNGQNWTTVGNVFRSDGGIAAFDLCVFQDNKIMLVCWVQNTGTIFTLARGAHYRILNTATDTFGSVTTLASASTASGSNSPNISVAPGNNGNGVLCVYNEVRLTRGTPFDKIVYTNYNITNVNAWRSTVTPDSSTESQFNARIHEGGDNLPRIIYTKKAVAAVNPTIYVVRATAYAGTIWNSSGGIGNANNTIALTAISTSDGDTYIFYTNTSNQLRYRRNASGDAWTSWSTAATLNASSRPLRISPFVTGDEIYLVYMMQSRNLEFLKKDSADVWDTTPTTLHSMVVDVSVYWQNQDFVPYGGTVIFEYVYQQNGTFDLYYDFYPLIVPEPREFPCPRGIVAIQHVYGDVLIQSLYASIQVSNIRRNIGISEIFSQITVEKIYSEAEISRICCTVTVHRTVGSIQISVLESTYTIKKINAVISLGKQSGDLQVKQNLSDLELCDHE